MRMLIFALWVCAAHAHAFPVAGKPVRIVVPFAPGGQTDIQARVIGGDAMKDHITGTVQLFFDGPTTAIANAKTGRVKLIATAAETRKAALPELPTLREAGYDVGMWGYLWFWGPAGMAPATVDALYRPLAAAIRHPAVKELFASGGSEASGMPPAEMTQAARSLHERWGAVIRSIGVKLD